MKGKLAGKAAIITGGGRGIGRAIALRFSREGAGVVLVSRTKSELKSTAAEIRNIGGIVRMVSADVTREKTARNAARICRKTFGKIDILVNAAGIVGPIGPLEDEKVSDWRKTLETNLTAAFLFMKAVLPSMKARRGGNIINLSGGGAASPRPMVAAYAASKAALVRLTETAAEETKPFNIRINAVAPGAVNTRMLDEMLNAGKKVGKAEYLKLRDQKKSGGVSPDRAADLAVFLASDESKGLSGRMISAVWDDWNSWKNQIGRIASTEWYTLRRLTPKP